ncbi:glutathione peroxidase [bacterium]|nr:glutathione peroxidase [bacterium]
MTDNFYDFTVTTLAGEALDLAKFKGQVALVVNTASECGLTPQYKGLQSIQDKYSSRGLVVIGFPSNDFGAQEPGEAEQIKSFCEINYGVTFPLITKNPVKGEDIQPVYDFLTSQTVSEFKGAIRWNFEKFLIDKNGSIAARFHPEVGPDDPNLIQQLEDLLDS